MYNIDNLNQLPYTPPQYYHQICRKKNMDITHCLIDPFYEERLNIYNTVNRRFNELIKDNTNLHTKKKIMKQLLHDTYKNYNKNLGFLPYSYFDKFKEHSFKIINNNSGSSLNELMAFIDSHVKKDNNYIIDPFYSFITLIDWLVQEIIEDKNINDDFIISFINKLIDEGYIGFNQYRFYIHVAIIRRCKDNFLIKLINLCMRFESELSKQFRFKYGYKKSLIKDIGKFALINHRFNFVRILIDKYELDKYNDIPYELHSLLDKI